MKKIKIGGIFYQIKRERNLEDANQSVWGVTQYEESLIKIREGMSKQKEEQTLIHESLHAMLHESGIDNLANDENLVTPLGNMLYQFITDNPQMINRIISTNENASKS